MTSSTPKNRVKPTATRAYMVPSISPLIRYCRAMSTPSIVARMERSAMRGHLGRQRKPDCAPLNRATAASLLELALARSVFAVLPDHPLAVLGDELGD